MSLRGSEFLCPFSLGQIYNPIMKPVDRMGFRGWRTWATREAHGRVLEIGCGTGLNFSHYPKGVHLVAFDPELDMLRESDPRIGAGNRIDLMRARAEDLPFPDNSFDSVVATLVFCTIPDPERALAEIKRVLKPGAPIRMVEHVRSHHFLFELFADFVTPYWKRIAGGCHLNRDTAAVVRAAGFKNVRVQERMGGLLIGIQAEK